ncbi:hypothetical protein [Prevotella melaninogenica]|uniref:hypothetical protein n=1 Tax=Prevotella melaninogenica TaxID=28132 RepID=UPI001BA8D045|nr:hypothetical protein [Prevotella melaninogenica]QUB66074.1 hypothetical protein J5A57_02975 [Prevotella melaninogenica]
MGTKARGGITLYNVKNGKDAEYHRLRPQSERAVVGADNSLYITLSYIIEYVNGAQVTTEVGSAQGYHVTARMNNGVSIAMTNGAVNSGTYKLTDYSKEQNRPDYVIIELRDSADKVVDIRTAQIIMEASSYVDIVADLRTTVSQHGDSISTIKQTADSISLKVDGIKNGVKNLIKGGQLNRTISRAFAMVNDGELTVKLKPETDYTLTVNGRISSSAWDKRQMLRTYIFDKSWKGFMVDCDIQATYDTTNSVTFRIPKDKASVDNTYCFNCYSFPNPLPQGKNGEVTVNWAVVTEGTIPAAEWIPSVEESSDEQIKRVEAKLENGEFRVKSDKTVFVDNSGKETVLIKDGKLSAELIDAVKIVAAGIQAQEIDAKEAKFKNLTVTGNSTFDGTINTNKGTIAGWKILPGMIGYGKDSDGLTLFDNCLIYNYKGTKRQVILGEDPLGKFAGKDMMLSLRNEPRSDFEKVGIFLDIHPDPTFGWKNNHAILSLRGTYGGFRRSLKVISENYSLGLGDSSILFVSPSTKTFTLPSSPEDGEEFTIYSVNGVDINFATTDNIPIEKLYTFKHSLNGTYDDKKYTFRVVYSKITSKWYVFLM